MSLPPSNYNPGTERPMQEGIAVRNTLVRGVHGIIEQARLEGQNINGIYLPPVLNNPTVSQFLLKRNLPRATTDAIVVVLSPKKINPEEFLSVIDSGYGFFYPLYDLVPETHGANIQIDTEIQGEQTFLTINYQFSEGVNLTDNEKKIPLGQISAKPDLTAVLTFVIGEDGVAHANVVMLPKNWRENLERAGLMDENQRLKIDDISDEPTSNASPPTLNNGFYPGRVVSAADEPSRRGTIFRARPKDAITRVAEQIEDLRKRQAEFDRANPPTVYQPATPSPDKVKTAQFKKKEYEAKKRRKEQRKKGGKGHGGVSTPHE